MRSKLRTVRLTPLEKALVDEYLAQNPIFDGFSALARVATLSFIGADASLRLRPVSGGSLRPRFLWDYDMSAAQAREVLAAPGHPDAKLWLIARILTEARFDEALEFLSADQIEEALPRLRLPAAVRERWDYALKRWKGASNGAAVRA